MTELQADLVALYEDPQRKGPQEPIPEDHDFDQGLAVATFDLLCLGGHLIQNPAPVDRTWFVF